MNATSVDLLTAAIHLGSEATSTLLPDFEWSADYLQAYSRRFARDGDDGRLVTAGQADEDWSIWERHAHGEEVVVVLSGRLRLLQEVDGEVIAQELTAVGATVNPKGVWHTVDVVEPGRLLFITPGRDTEHRAR